MASSLVETLTSASVLRFPIWVYGLPNMLGRETSKTFSPNLSSFSLQYLIILPIAQKTTQHTDLHEMLGLTNTYYLQLHNQLKSLDYHLGNALRVLACDTYTL